MSYPSQDWQSVAELRGHDNWIYGIVFAPENQLLSISGNEVLLWNIKTQNVKFRFRGHNDLIICISLDASQRVLASGSLDKTIRLWNIETGGLIGELAKRKDPIHSVTFSPDGKLLASGGENKYKTDDGKKTTIYLWNVDSQELVNSFSGHDLRVNALAFSPDGEILASGSNDSTVRIWNVKSGKQLHNLKGHSSNIGSIAFTQDGKRLISSGGGGIRIWDCDTGELIHCLAKESEYVRCFAVDPLEEFLAFEAHEYIEIYDLKTLEKLSSLKFKWPTSLSFSPDGEYLASGDATAFDVEGGVIKLWRKSEESIFPDVINPIQVHVEGAKKQVFVNAYERNSTARKECINYYGAKCVICDFDFGLKYGLLGEGLIHVHHLVPLSEIGQEYKVDPVKDMRPVCPNCHAIIHRRSPPLKVDEVKALLDKAKDSQPSEK